MFRRRRDGLFDLCVAAVCVWGAAYHTPVGALARSAVAWATGGHAVTRSLLAYYSGGRYEAVGPATALPAPAVPVGVHVTELAALVQGARVVLAEAPEFTATARDVARRAGVEGEGPEALAQALEAAGTALGSREAALVALFCGWETASYAVERSRAAGEALEFDALARHVPPSQAAPIAAAARAVAAGTAYALAWPVDAQARVSSAFGWRTHPTLGTRKLHTGVDLAVGTGTDVRATGEGVVRRASEDAYNGRVLVVDHGHGVQTAYCHNSELLVAVGARVEVGQVVARSGNTGRSSGPHLHYQLDVGARPVDPFAYRVAPEALVRVGDE